MMVEDPEETTRKPVRIWPIYKEDYGHHYGAIRYAGKKVLDVGADVGSTADFFLRRGAREVVAVEGDARMFEELKKNAAKIPEIKPIFMWIRTPGDYIHLIELHRPDVLKADCEGCEVHLLSIPDHIFQRVPEYMIETHTSKTEAAMMEKFKKNGYELVKVVKWHPGVDILYAKKP